MAEDGKDAAPRPALSAKGRAKAAAREARLAAALRRNLHRRKAQARARDAALRIDGDDAGGDPDTGQRR